jgi:DNA invertase Pin-like site-specific DNA recombinase
MFNQKYISYLRVSTQQQGRSGLGIEAQKQAVQEFLKQYPGELLAEFVEVESGKNSNRPELNKAIDFCELTGGTLVVAKLDRLSRDLHFLTSLQKRNLQFKICDMPQIDELTVHVLGATAQHELRLISNRTRTALAQAKARGVQLGNPNLNVIRNRDVTAANKVRSIAQAEWRQKILRIIQHHEKMGITSCKGLAEILNKNGLKSYRGKPFTTAIVSKIRRSNNDD